VGPGQPAELALLPVAVLIAVVVALVASTAVVLAAFLAPFVLLGVVAEWGLPSVPADDRPVYSAALAVVAVTMLACLIVVTRRIAVTTARGTSHHEPRA
jgi:hypothetical protein